MAHHDTGYVDRRDERESGVEVGCNCRKGGIAQCGCKQHDLHDVENLGNGRTDVERASAKEPGDEHLATQSGQ